MKRTLVRALIAAALVSNACSPVEDRSGSRADAMEGFQTSRPRYEVRGAPGASGIEIPYVYNNVTGDSVYFVNCNGIIVPSLEKQTGQAWTAVWHGETPACLSPPVVVPPGGEYADTVRVRSNPDIYPLLSFADPEGTYRLVWYGVVHSYRNEGPHFGTPLSQDERTSNEFTVSVQPE